MITNGSLFSLVLFLFFQPQGQQIDFVKSDENSRKWLNEFRTKPFSVPGKLEDVDGKNILHCICVILLKIKHLHPCVEKACNTLSLMFC